MDRALKSILIVIVLSALASCGIFFTPMEGRWNPDDPKNELQTFNPTIDGYAHSTTPLWVGDSSLLAYPGSKIIVLRFDTADFPRVVAALRLQMTIATAISGDAQLSIFRIISDWDTATISYDVVNGIDSTFYDDSRIATYTIPGSVSAGEEIEIPLGEVFSGNRDDLKKGIVIYSSINVTFKSTEDGSPPVLLVEPE